MTIQDIEASLPNGFHDASLLSVEINYENEQARLRISVSLWEPDATDDQLRDAYREGVILLKGLLFFAIEPPRVLERATKELWVPFSGPVDGSEELPISIPKDLPSNVFVHHFFSSDTNSYIFFAASEASFTWSDDNGEEGA